MALRFIIGPAGSGKTHRIVTSIVEGLALEGPNMILLVPDQATFGMERQILSQPGVQGFTDLRILSFRRLAFRVLEETGGLSLPFISRVGRNMAIQSILWDRRDDLTVFAPLINYPGFRDTLGRCLTELSEYGFEPEAMLRVKAGEEEPFLKQKLGDLSCIFAGYKEFLEGRYQDPEDYLDFAAQRMPDSSLAQGATVWVDGFSGFSPKEYKVLKTLMVAAEDVHIALCLDESSLKRPLSPGSVFHPTRETYEKILGLAWDAGVRVDPPVYLEDLSASKPDVLPRWRWAPRLAALEREFRGQNRPPETTEAAQPDLVQPDLVLADGAQSDLVQADGEGDPRREVRVVAATNPQAEIEFLAREITRLVRDEGFRYKDIVVECRELGVYGDILPLVFGDHKIPFFLDMKRPQSHHPLVELIRAALDVAVTGWRPDAVFRYLKTDLVPVARDDVDFLENYVLSHGIIGESWMSSTDWGYTKGLFLPEDEDGETAQRAVKDRASDVEAAVRADAIRRRAIRELTVFYRRLRFGDSSCRRSEVSLKDVTDAVYSLLEDLGAAQRLEEWRDDAEETGNLIEARDHAGLWEQVMEVLTEAGEVLKDQIRDIETISLLIGAGLESVRLGAIPPSLDQVLVGTLDRSRQPEVKAVFLIGALQGALPKRQVEDSIFTDGEREHLRGLGVDLEPSSSVRQLHEKYLVYIALTRASRCFYISYPLGDQEGKAQTPSHVIDWVKQRLPEVKEEIMPEDPPGAMPEDMDYLLSARVQGAVARRLANLRQGILPGDCWMEAYRWLIEGDRLLDTRRALGSLGYSNRLGPLPAELVKSLYGPRLRTSVSRLETFAACPFWHFARDGLGLKERDLYKLEPADAGVFLHAALKDFVEGVVKSGKDWNGLSSSEVEGLVDGVSHDLLSRTEGDVLTSTARYRYISSALRRMLRRASRTILSHMNKGSLRPIANEVLFGFPNGPRPLEVPLKGGQRLFLRGQIDRVDAFLGEGGAYVRVVDYKSSKRALDLIDVYYGLSLQLLVYLLVALNSWKDIAPPELAAASPQPAGVLYFPVIDPLVATDGPCGDEEALQLLSKNLRMSGLIAGESDDTYIVRLMDKDADATSSIIPVRFLKSGKLYARSQTASREDFSALLEFVGRKVGEMGEKIFSGRVDIRPYRRGTRRACRFCPYGPLCVFDALIDGNEYRYLESPGGGGIWDEIRNFGGSGGED